MLSGRVQYSKTLFFSPSTCPPRLLSRVIAILSIHHLSSPFPRGFSIPCHTWPPPAHYALFCVMPVDAGASGALDDSNPSQEPPFSSSALPSVFLSDGHILCLSLPPLSTRSSTCASAPLLMDVKVELLTNPPHT